MTSTGDSPSPALPGATALSAASGCRSPDPADAPPAREQVLNAAYQARVCTAAVLCEAQWLLRTFEPGIKKRFERAVANQMHEAWYGLVQPANSPWGMLARLIIPCSYWEPAELVKRLSSLEHDEARRDLAMLLANKVRNSDIENIHVNHISDRQMKRLNIGTRAALYSALVALDREEVCEASSAYLSKICVYELEGYRPRRKSHAEGVRKGWEFRNLMKLDTFDVGELVRRHVQNQQRVQWPTQLASE